MERQGQEATPRKVEGNDFSEKYEEWGKPSSALFLPPNNVVIIIPPEGEEFLPGGQEMSGCSKAIDAVDKAITSFLRKYRVLLRNGFLWLLFVGYSIYFGFALSLNFHRSKGLLVLTVLVAAFVLFKAINKVFGGWICSQFEGPVHNATSFIQSNKKAQWVVDTFLVIILIAFTAGFGVFHTLTEHPQQLISAFGLLVFILFSFLCSKRPAKINWRTIIWGLALQLVFGILILRTYVGYQAFLFFGQNIQTFLEYADIGSEFVFSPPLEAHFFVFKVLPVILYCAFIIGMLYYLGLMQWFIGKIAWVMHYTMGISAAESLCTAANIFFGMNTAPLVVKPYLNGMTMSELHVVITGGLATIAGSVLGAYILFGINASHLLSASVMSAPAAVAISKMFYPELEIPKTLKSNINQTSSYSYSKDKPKNILEAAVNEVSIAIQLCAGITANLICIIAFVAFINAVLSWLGGMVNYPQLNFQVISRYVLYPVVWLMGIYEDDCLEVAELVGTKLFLNEFVAYSDLAILIKNRQMEIEPTISVRSEVIATYALCGFSSLASLGVLLGSLGPLMPNRKGDLASLVFSGLVSSSIACFITACVAGILYDDGPRLFESGILQETNTTYSLLNNTVNSYHLNFTAV